ncbi:MAG: lytic transglycosylase domain-containing protein [Pseudomonadota bacterium]
MTSLMPRASARSETRPRAARRGAWRRALTFAAVGAALACVQTAAAQPAHGGGAALEVLDPGGDIGVAPPRAPAPRLRAQALLDARLDGLPARPEPSSIAALAATQSVDQLVADLVFWRAARSGEFSDWDEARAFLIRRPQWPLVRPLRVAVERKLPETIPAAETLEFFGAEPPLTARGARLYGEALILSGRTQEGEAEIIRGWSRLPGTLSEERLYQSQHAALLEAHHASRFETMLWRERLDAAGRLTKHLPKGWDRLADAITALHRSSGGVDRKIARVPKALAAHPALAYARTLWRERRRRRADAEQAMRAADAVGSIGRAIAWADKRMRFARDAFEDGRAADAAAMAGAHRLERGVAFANLEWFAGWMRLSKLNEPQRALGHFARLWAGVSTPISRSRAAYWAGAAADAAGEAETAAFWRERAAALPSAFYGQLAAERAGVTPDLADAPQSAAPFDRAELDAVERELLEAAELLYFAEWRASARRFMRAIAARRSDARSLGWLARRARDARDHYGEIEIAKRAFEIGAPLWSSLYPIPRTPDFTGRRVEPGLLLAIARQESRFMWRAASGAGARGLMQVMPGTAKVAAKRVKLPYDAERLAGDPEYGLALADAHLEAVLGDFNGSYVLAIAAYNAGGGNVKKWIKRFGDPRGADVDPIAWIESIPFKETRNYVQRVMEGLQIYRIRLGEAEDLQLTRDLKR